MIFINKQGFCPWPKIHPPPQTFRESMVLSGCTEYHFRIHLHKHQTVSSAYGIHSIMRQSIILQTRTSNSPLLRSPGLRVKNRCRGVGGRRVTGELQRFVSILKYLLNLYTQVHALFHHSRLHHNHHRVSVKTPPVRTSQVHFIKGQNDYVRKEAIIPEG